MEPSELAGPESLTTRSTESMEVDGLSVSASPSRSDTPLIDTQDSSGTDAEKGIVVDAPAIKAPTVGLARTTPIMLGQQVQAEEGDGWSSSEPPSPVQITPVHASTGTKRKRSGIPHLSVPFKRLKKPEVHGVMLGVWSSSDEPDDADKHVVHGFLDRENRLRLRIYHMNRRGEELIGNAPAGAGGCWVKFGDIIFEDHLKGMAKDEIHEYVLSQSDPLLEASPAERADTNTRAALTARAYVAGQAAATTGPVNQRAELRRPSRFTPRQTISRPSTPGARFQGSVDGHNAVDMGSPAGSQSADQGRTDVLLGVWKPSDCPNDADKHTVYGSITAKGQIRCKIQRVTRDGRFVDRNFPVGPGQLWLAVESDDIGFEQHLEHLDRNVVKEYVRIRSFEQYPGESQQQRQANELDAVHRAQQIVANASRNTPATISVVPSHGSRGPPAREPPEVSGPRRGARRSDHMQPVMHQANANAMRVGNAQANNQANSQANAKQQQQFNEAVRAEFKSNTNKLNKIWVAQQAAGSEVRRHNGIKYERKPNGPLVGKLVSPGVLINIDGEDFVEYRVLTRPF